MASTVIFGPNKIPLSQVFLRTKLTCALVNLKPILRGHVLVVPNRLVRRYNDLTREEISDLFYQGQRISRVLEELYKADSLTMAIQDGPAAGQTVPHVHLHIIPRHFNDFENNDEVYAELDERRKPAPLIDNESRAPRSAQDMADEAVMMRKFFEPWDELAPAASATTAELRT